MNHNTLLNIKYTFDPKFPSSKLYYDPKLQLPRIFLNCCNLMHPLNRKSVMVHPM